MFQNCVCSSICFRRLQLLCVGSLLLQGFTAGLLVLHSDSCFTSFVFHSVCSGFTSSRGSASLVCWCFTGGQLLRQFYCFVSWQIFHMFVPFFFLSYIIGQSQQFIENKLIAVVIVNKILLAYYKQANLLIIYGLSPLCIKAITHEMLCMDASRFHECLQS